MKSILLVGVFALSLLIVLSQCVAGPDKDKARHTEEYKQVARAKVAARKLRKQKHGLHNGGAESFREMERKIEERRAKALLNRLVEEHPTEHVGAVKAESPATSSEEGGGIIKDFLELHRDEPAEHPFNPRDVDEHDSAPLLSSYPYRLENYYAEGH